MQGNNAPAALVRGERNLALTNGKARVYRDLKALSPGEMEVRAQSIARTNRARAKLVQILDRKMRGFLRDQGRRIAADLPKSDAEYVALSRKHQHAMNESVDVFVKAVTDWDHEEDLLREILMRFYGESGQSAFGDIAATVGVEIAWDVSNPFIREMLDTLGQRIVGINETTREQVSETIIAGQEAGMSPQQIADAVAEHIEETYKGRAMNIALTETQVSYNLSSQRAYQASGVVENVEMIDGVEHDEDYGASDGLTCAQRNGMIVNVGQMDRHIEAEHPRGSLAFAPILATPLGVV